MCTTPRCTKVPNFNIPGELEGLYCKSCATSGMINVVRQYKKKGCKEPGCVSTSHSFNNPGESRGLYCASHKKDGMVDVVSRRCAEDGCLSTSHAFSKPGEKRGLYCASHKKDGMVDVVSRRCAEEGCSSTSIVFNTIGEKKGIYCAEHKKVGMLDVVSRRCAEDGCFKSWPVFNFKGHRKGLYCVAHKKDGMMDVVSKLCTEPGCTHAARWNISGSTSGLYCSKHAKPNMIDVWSPMCTAPGCVSYAYYNTEGSKKGIFCWTHKLDGMILLNTPRCKTPMCDLTVNKNRNEGYCLSCFIHTYPDRPVFRNYKTKERSVVEYIFENFLELSWVADKQVLDGCSRKRPDLLLDLGYQVLIVEIDENAHSSYNSSCETKRLCLLSQDVQERPLVMIRFNPDAYGSVSSCWEIDGLGMCVVKKDKVEEWNERLGVLKYTLSHWLRPENASNKLIHVVNLFMDLE